MTRGFITAVVSPISDVQQRRVRTNGSALAAPVSLGPGPISFGLRSWATGRWEGPEVSPGDLDSHAVAAHNGSVWIRRSLMVLAVLSALLTTGCSKAITKVTSCAPSDAITLPGASPVTIGGVCGAYSGYTSANNAPTVELHIGQVVRLAHFHNRPQSSAPAVARVSLDAAASRTRHTIWDLTATAVGIVVLYDHVGVCGDGAAARCAIANFRIIR